MRSTGDKVRGWGLAIWSVLALIYLFVPIFIVVLFSFNDNKGRFNFTWQGFTLDHWTHPFANPDLALAMKNSLLIALITTLIATALGTFMAMALVRYSFRGRGVPSRAALMKSPVAGMNVSSEPAKIPGRASGSVTRRNAVTRLA